MTKLCIQLYFHTYKHIPMYLYRHVEYLQFLRVEFSSLSTVGNPEDSLFSFLLFSAPQISLSVLLPPPPPLPTFSPLLLSSLVSHISHSATIQQATCSGLLCSRRREREWYWRDLPSEFQCPSQRTRPLILNTRQRCNSNHKKDWDLWSEPSLTLRCPGWYWLLW